MASEKNQKEVLGGADGTARCRCGRLRYPRYSLCPKCYYKEPQVSVNPKKLSRADLLKMQAPKPMPLSDRQERIRFLENRYGLQLRGQDIRFYEEYAIICVIRTSGLSSTINFGVFGVQFWTRLY